MRAIDIANELVGRPSKTLRDEFAMAALSGLCAQSQINAFSHRSGDTAEKAYRLADAMMEARDAKR